MKTTMLDKVKKLYPTLAVTCGDALQAFVDWCSEEVDNYDLGNVYDYLEDMDVRRDAHNRLYFVLNDQVWYHTPDPRASAYNQFTPADDLDEKEWPDLVLDP